MESYIPQQIYSPISNPQVFIYQPTSSPQYSQVVPLTSQINLIPTTINPMISNAPIIPFNANNVLEVTDNNINGYTKTYLDPNNVIKNNGKNDFNIRYTFVNNNANYIPYQIATSNYLENNNNNDNFGIEYINKSDEFKTSIRLFIQHLELNDGEQSITAPSIALGIKRRRLYDVINVFESIGCCKKCALDSVIWIGKSNIKNTFEMIVKQKNLYNPKATLADFFPIDQCIGVSNLTLSFVLLFYALKTDHLDLRYVAQFFSRKSSRYKTTLCKLYQISYIMNAIELMNRTTQVCEVVISNGYFNIDIVPEIDEKAREMVSIQSLLVDNRKEDTDVILKRRKEFKKYYSENMKQ